MNNVTSTREELLQEIEILKLEIKSLKAGIGEDLVVSHITDFIAEEAAKLRNPKAEEFRAVGGEYYETVIKNRLGETLNINVKEVFFDFMDRRLTMNIYRDITSRKESQINLNTLLQVVQQVDATIFIFNLDGIIEFANTKTYERFGPASGMLVGENLRVVYSPEITEEAYLSIWDTISTGNKWVGEFHRIEVSGKQFWESYTITPLLNEEGIVVRYLTVIKDITEDIGILGKLTDFKRKADLSEKLIDAFIGNISHEIRTPLNGILGSTGLILESYSDLVADSDKMLYSSLEAASQRLINTVDQILIYSRLQVGDYILCKETVSLAHILQSLINSYQKQLSGKNIQMSFDSTLLDDTIFADPKALIRAFESLLSNAVKYTKAGTIRVSITRDKSDNLCLSIIDSGLGIAEEYLDQLFEPFSQELIGYCRPYEGLGLGLPLTKKLLNLSGACISAISKKGEGTEFIVCFNNLNNEQSNIIPKYPESPLFKIINLPESTVSGVQAAIKEFDIIPSSPSPDGKKPKVLIIEDDEANQIFIEVILKVNYETIIANSAEEALELLDESLYDLILIDNSLKQGLDGLQVSRLIRNSFRNPNIPIILLTGLGNDIYNIKAAGCDDILEKPFQRQDLLNKVSTALGAA